MLTHLRPELPIQPEPSLAEARHPALLGHPLPDGLEQAALFRGHRQSLRWTGPGGETAELRLLQGRFAPGPALCRLTLEGPAPIIQALAITLASHIGLGIPRTSLAQQALLAAGHPPFPRVMGLPLAPSALAPDPSVSTSLAAIIARQLEAMLHWADQVPGTRSPEPVHQMRVATRRLRSALSVSRQAAPSLTTPDAAAPSLASPLQACAARLGAARDWDVFLEDTAPRLTNTLSDTLHNDRRYPAMLRAATRRRTAAYADLRAYLAGPGFRTLATMLACAAALRPWEDERHPALEQPTSLFAAQILARRLRRVHKAGRGLATLSLPALHELRKDCKRLRYAAEFFRPLLPSTHAKRFLARLADLQEELGLLNDTASISGLMAQLGRPHTFAAGLVEGFSAAGARPARTRIARRWKAFRDAKPFW